jgi:hypothetical protein
VERHIYPMNKNRLWRPCLLTDRDEMSNHYRGPSIDASYLSFTSFGWGVSRAKTGWLGIRIMCPSGATYLPNDCCKLTLPKAMWAFTFTWHPSSVVCHLFSWNAGQVIFVFSLWDRDEMSNLYIRPSIVAFTKFWFIWLRSFRGNICMELTIKYKFSNQIVWS